MGLPHFVADALDGQCDWDDNMAEGNFIVTTPAVDGFTGPPERWLLTHVDNHGGRYFTQGFHARKAGT
jgi:plasmid replication initiation protein